MIAVNVDELNQILSHDLREPIRFGIGIHGGEVIIGDIGYATTWCSPRSATPSTSRQGCRTWTKSLACEAIVSEEVRITAGVAQDALPQQQVEIRGRSEPMIVRSVGDAKALAALVDDMQIAAA